MRWFTYSIITAVIVTLGFLSHQEIQAKQRYCEGLTSYEEKLNDSAPPLLLMIVPRPWWCRNM